MSKHTKGTGRQRHNSFDLSLNGTTPHFSACHSLQVRTYSKVFWKRFKELGEDQGEKYIKQIERGEQRIQRQQDIMDAIAAKMDRYRNPWQVHFCQCCFGLTPS